MPERVRHVPGEGLDLCILDGPEFRTLLSDPHLGISRHCGPFQFHHDAHSALCVLSAILVALGFQREAGVLANLCERNHRLLADRSEHSH